MTQLNQDLVYKKNKIFTNMETQNYENRQFMILNLSELNSIDFSQVLETSEETVRKSVDETKTFVKWDGVIPFSVNSLTTKEGPYTYSEIIDILNTPEWFDKDANPYNDIMFVNQQQ